MLIQTNCANVTLILANPNPQRKIKARAYFLRRGLSLFAKPGLSSIHQEL
jgi:hypothetical protein